jgi:hypothetical protein
MSKEAIENLVGKIDPSSVIKDEIKPRDVREQLEALLPDKSSWTPVGQEIGGEAGFGEFKLPRKLLTPHVSSKTMTLYRGISDGREYEAALKGKIILGGMPGVLRQWGHDVKYLTPNREYASRFGSVITYRFSGRLLGPCHEETLLGTYVHTAADTFIGEGLPKAIGSLCDGVYGPEHGVGRVMTYGILDFSKLEIIDIEVDMVYRRVGNGSRPMPRYMGKVASAARVASRYAATTPLPPSFPDTEPGLMTAAEFIAFRNPQGKFHDSDAYDFDLMKMNMDHSFRSEDYRFNEYEIEKNPRGAKVTRDGNLVAVIHNGTMYLEDPKHKNKIVTQWRDQRGEDHDLDVTKYKKVKYLAEKMPLISAPARNNLAAYPVLLQNLIVKGEPMTLRAEKTPSLNEMVNLAVLNSEGLEVAVAQNEWGATLFVVAQEYRGKGLGKIIGKKWYELNPSSGSGGFTEAGKANALALWEDRVKEFMGRGWYSELIREGRLTHQQVKAILAGIGQRSPRPAEPEELDETKPTGDVLIYVDEDNISFIVYDRAFLEDPDDRFIHGYGFLRSNPHQGTYFFALDYDWPFADLVTRVGLQMAKNGGDYPLYDGEGYSDTLELDGIPGIEREGDYFTLTKDLLPGLGVLARKERGIRRAMDPYDEKFYLLQEQANAKWR